MPDISNMKYQHNITSGMVGTLPVIYMEGDLTSEADSDVKAVYNRLKEEQPLAKLIVNFEKTSYINSSGIATLIHIIRDVNDHGGVIGFVGMSDHLKKVMSIVGISDFVKTFETNADALAKL